MCDVEELECSVKKFLEMERGTPAIYGLKKKGQYEQMHMLYQLVSENSLVPVFICVFLLLLLKERF